MDREQQHVVVRTTGEERRPHDRAALEIERPSSRGGDTPSELLGGRRQRLDVLEPDRIFSVNPLDWLPALHLERRSQGRVSVHEGLKDGLKQVGLDSRPQPRGEQDVVRGALRREMMEKPQRLLTV
jgi:hypothetical protein